MSSQLVFNLTHVLLAISLLLGFSEYIYLIKNFKKVFSHFKYLAFILLLILGITSILFSFYQPQLLALTLLVLMGFLIIFDGSFNGGSDYMNFLVTLSLSVYTFSNSEIIKTGCLLYIGAQSILSYFIAGFTKLLKPNWRNGQSLNKVINESHYLITQEINKFLSKFKSSFKFLSWFVIVLEISMPLGFVNFNIGVILIGMFFLFHLINIRLLKLNRFFFAWLSSYACIMFCFYKAAGY